MNQPQLPAYLMGGSNRNLAAKAQQSLGASAPPYISIQGGRFALVDSGGNFEEQIQQPDGQIRGMFDQRGACLDVVIADLLERPSKIFYMTAFNPNSDSYLPPTCWSDNGIAPSSNAAPPPEAQCGPTCAACPHSAWGSSERSISGRAKACGDYQKLALIIPNYYRQMVFLLRVPPNSLKNFRAYSEMFNGRGVEIHQIITRIRFQSDVLGTLTFEVAGWTDPQTHQISEKAFESGLTTTLVGRNDQPRTPALGYHPGYHPTPAAVAPPPPAHGYQPTPFPAGNPPPPNNVVPGPGYATAPVGPTTVGPAPAPMGAPPQPYPAPGPSPMPATGAAPAAAPAQQGSKRRPGRPKNPAAQPGPVAGQPNQAPQQEVLPPNGGNMPHGIGPAAPPNQELTDDLTKFFGPPQQ